MRAPTPGGSADAPSSSPAPARPRGGHTLLWGFLGLCCSAGVVLAVLDPSWIGVATGSASATAPTEAPPAVAPAVSRPARPAPAPVPEPTAEPEPESAGVVGEDRAKRLIDKLIGKMRRERQARKAAQRGQAERAPGEAR